MDPSWVQEGWWVENSQNGWCINNGKTLWPYEQMGWFGVFFKTTPIFGNMDIMDKIEHPEFHQKLNGTESQRTPKSQVSCDCRAMIDTQFFLGVREKWVLWVRFLGNHQLVQLCQIPSLNYRWWFRNPAITTWDGAKTFNWCRISAINGMIMITPRFRIPWKVLFEEDHWHICDCVPRWEETARKFVSTKWSRNLSRKPTSWASPNFNSSSTFFRVLFFVALFSSMVQFYYCMQKHGEKTRSHQLLWCYGCHGITSSRNQLPHLWRFLGWKHVKTLLWSSNSDLTRPHPKR